MMFVPSMKLKSRNWKNLKSNANNTIIELTKKLPRTNLDAVHKACVSIVAVHSKRNFYSLRPIFAHTVERKKIINNFHNIAKIGDALSTFKNAA